MEVLLYGQIALVIALVMVSSFLLPYIAKRWSLLVLIVTAVAGLCVWAFGSWLPTLTKPWQAFVPAMGIGLFSVGVAFGIVTWGIILFRRSRSHDFDALRTTYWGIAAMLVSTCSTLWILG